jgi:hypothetical protein
MGRPKGSRNKKRKYTRRRKSNGIRAVNGPEAAETFALVNEAKDLQLKVRSLVMVASPAVRRVAIADLIADLQWMAQVQEDSPPAP